MNRHHLAFGLVVVATHLLPAPPARAGEVPFAQEPISRPGVAQPAPIGLADIMGLTQLRHIKLFYAARARNWPLVDYELDQLEQSVVRAATLYVNIPVQDVEMVSMPVRQMRAAAASRDAPAFGKAFDALTAACNACHRDASVPFIRIVSPKASPITDQDWSPGP
jgi:hypothetical protein